MIVQIVQELIVSLIVIVAAILAVLSGFGFVLFSAPLLSYIYEPVQTVSLTIALSTLLLGLLLLITDIRKSMDVKLVIKLVAWSLIGIPIGILLLPLIDKSTHRFVLGFFTIAYVFYRGLGRNLKLPNSKLCVPIAGILGGILSTSTGFSAIPVILVLGCFDLNPYEDRATLAGYVFGTGVFSLVAYQLVGITTVPELETLLFLIPPMLIGLLIGIFFVHRISAKGLNRAFLLYLGVIGLFAILPSLF